MRPIARVYKFLAGTLARLHGNTFYTVYMNRRIDEKTSHRIELTLLTSAAFGQHSARTFARLSGLDPELVTVILERPAAAVRQHSTFFLAPKDRRSEPR